MLGQIVIVLFALIISGNAEPFQQKDQSLFRELTDYELKMSEQAGYSYVDRLTQLEEELYAQGQFIGEDSPLYRMSKFKQPSPQAMELSAKAVRMLEATKFLKNEMELTNVESRFDLRQSSSNFSIINNTCLAVTPCTSATKYRAINGSCNSLTNTNLGMSNTDYRRLVTPAYADGIQSPRSTSSNGTALPSARAISVSVFGGADRLTNSTTLALMQFGQFINHDMESTTQFTFTNGTAVSCCSSTGGSLNASQLHPACFPIAVATDDKFLNNNKARSTTTCMNFVRSITGPRLNCSLGYADQLNQNTHWLDASTVYGSESATLATLRSFTGGLLKTTNDTANKRQLLPQTTPCPSGACYFAGDSRATEQPQLTVMHTLWMREHNRIAKTLSQLNPTWSDESVFQETRRIVIAEMQHITYNEFIPALLSPSTIAKYGLAPLTSGFLTNYTNTSTGPVSNEFATSAFRMGHSMVQGTVQLFAENGSLLPTSYNLSSTFNSASMIAKDPTYFDAAIRGLLTQQSEAVDQLVVDALWLQLFKAFNKTFGFDLVALNIQRGRDHGLPSYNTYRQLCGFSNLTSWADLTVNPSPPLSKTTPSFPSQIVTSLSSIYSSPNDIDLYVGGLVELAMSGSIVGPTLNCLLGENFQKIKYSDRYFYEIGGQPNSFSAAQLAEIRKSSLARIFCDNSDGGVLSLQPKAFITVNNSTNAKVQCTNTTSIPSLNLTVWKGVSL